LGAHTNFRTGDLTMNKSNSATMQVLSVSPVTLRVAGRATDLQLRVSAPVTGSDLPILLLSHGHGPSNHVSSLNGYAPLANYFAARGFVVIQPTHLDSKTLPFRDSDLQDAPLFARSRAEDMRHILDRLEEIEREVPAIAGRLNRTKVAVIGHSMGGHTASVLLGARYREPRDGTLVNLVDPRIKAGVLLAAPGRGGDALSQIAAERYAFFKSIDFSTMTAPALVVAGDKDNSTHLTVAGPAWHEDPYALAPSPKSLLTVFGGEHGLGGVSGYDAAETTDENPERVAVVAQMVSAFLRSALYPEDRAWPSACEALKDAREPLGRVESK
jgi:predicted dienelactone hydrolase